MKLIEHKEDFNKRWNISSPDSDETDFKEFRQRIINVFESIEINKRRNRYVTYTLKGIDNIITKESALDFRQYYSIPEKSIVIGGGIGIDIVTIIDRLKTEENKKEFYKLIEVILNFLNIEDGIATTGEETKKLIIKEVEKAFKLSKLDVTFSQSNDKVIIYPQGEKRLDEELVNKTLSFLDDKSKKHFEEALKFYQDKDPVKSAESLRRSLEEFLRYKLENQKGLKNNIEALQKVLKNNSDSTLRNIIFQVFNYLDQYFNENSKHKDGNITEPENEFIIYQSGLIMRYINKLGMENLLHKT